MVIVHKSKTDLWLLAVLIAAMGASAFASAMVLLASPPSTWWLLVITLGIGVGLPLWLLLATDYTLASGQLLVRSGPFRWQIPVASIRSITPTRNPLSSPALSLDRLRIEYGHGAFIMVSPRDKDRFLRDISSMQSGAG